VVVMSNSSEPRVFYIDFGCDIFPPDEWLFDRDGKIVESEKDKFFSAWSEHESQEEILKRIEEYEQRAKIEIAKIIQNEVRIQAEWRPETEEERKAKWIESQKRETEEYLSRTADLKEALHNRMNN
jgi:beta-phosphoglucomutase-like phosphatase (HAD superfamily)